MAIRSRKRLLPQLLDYNRLWSMFPKRGLWIWSGSWWGHCKSESNSCQENNFVQETQEEKLIMKFSFSSYNRNISHILNSNLCDTREHRQLVMEAPSWKWLYIFGRLTSSMFTGGTCWKLYNRLSNSCTQHSFFLFLST